MHYETDTREVSDVTCSKPLWEQFFGNGHRFWVIPRGLTEADFYVTVRLPKPADEWRDMCRYISSVQVVLYFRPSAAVLTGLRQVSRDLGEQLFGCSWVWDKNEKKEHHHVKLCVVIEQAVSFKGLRKPEQRLRRLNGVIDQVRRAWDGRDPGLIQERITALFQVSIDRWAARAREDYQSDVISWACNSLEAYGGSDQAIKAAGAEHLYQALAALRAQAAGLEAAIRDKLVAYVRADWEREAKEESPKFPRPVIEAVRKRLEDEDALLRSNRGRPSFNGRKLF